MKPTWKNAIKVRKPKHYKHTCKVCGRGFKASRSHAGICSARCRQTLHRRRTAKKRAKKQIAREGGI